MKVSLKFVSALVKVFHDQEPAAYPKHIPASFLQGELYSLQAAYCLTEDIPRELPIAAVHLECPLQVTVRQVFGVPVRFPRFLDSDDNYIISPGKVYPDLLRNVYSSNHIRLYPHQWDALWLDIDPQPDTPPGMYPIKISLKDKAGQTLACDEMQVELLAQELPKQKLVHARWLHADSLAQHYHYPALSIEHHRVWRNYTEIAAMRGVNMIYTPIHTPPLDTMEGGERMTVQLVDVFKTPTGYQFKFGKLRDFVTMCRHVGIQYFEIAHLFTQWGGHYAPKIMGVRDGSYTQLFGWKTEATSPEYREFLAAYLPALAKEMEYLDLLDNCYFHLTDEPGLNHREQYHKLYEMVQPMLPEGAKLLDALSEPEIMPKDSNLIPVPSVDKLEGFSNLNLRERWTYYCIGQHKDVTNTFIAMPAPRTRILGIQLYLKKMDGFLHWAFNFYFSQYSQHPIDPYLNTDCDGFAPAGDAFQVYPGEGGQPEESLRLLLFQHAMQDLRALQLLESLTDREYVVRLIEEGLHQPLTMYRYPLDEAWLLNLRHRVNEQIRAHGN
jgi:hypothetical protein